MKTYLVTGAAGFIGANFLKYILKKYENINVIVINILTPETDFETKIRKTVKWHLENQE